MPAMVPQHWDWSAYLLRPYTEAFRSPMDSSTLGPTTFIYDGLLAPRVQCKHTIVPAKEASPREMGSGKAATRMVAVAAMRDDPNRDDERYATRSGVCTLNARLFETQRWRMGWNKVDSCWRSDVKDGGAGGVLGDGDADECAEGDGGSEGGGRRESDCRHKYAGRSCSRGDSRG